MTFRILDSRYASFNILTCLPMTKFCFKTKKPISRHNSLYRCKACSLILLTHELNNTDL